MKPTHSLYKKICPNWRDYMAAKMGVDNYGSDCSCGCKYFYDHVGVSADWGLCLNTISPRAGLLTWEHMGCPFNNLLKRGGPVKGERNAPE